MINSDNSLELLPGAAFEIRTGTVTAVNRAAARLLPGLIPGMASPVDTASLTSGDTSAGTFVLDGLPCRFRLTALEGSCLVLFDPAPQTALSPAQMEGYLIQMHQLESEFVTEFHSLARKLEDQPEVQDRLAAFRQSFYRFLRLNGNLEFLHRTECGTLPFSPVTLDLVSLCGRAADEAGALLAQGGTVLTFHCQLPRLLLSGDPALLQQLVLGLLSNAAKFGDGDAIDLRLLRRPTHAILLVQQNAALSPAQLDGLIAGQASGELPAPEQGAGMGLSVIRHIVTLHGGLLLWKPTGNGLAAAVCLPLGQPDCHLGSVNAPPADGGFSPLLTQLSDALPLSVFREAELD